MKALITVTDDERFEFLSHQDDHDEVNFWRPRDMETPRIEPGTPYLFKLKQLLEDHVEEIARIITTENGKTLGESRGELRRAIENVEGVGFLVMDFHFTFAVARDHQNGEVRSTHERSVFRDFVVSDKSNLEEK